MLRRGCIMERSPVFTSAAAEREVEYSREAASVVKWSAPNGDVHSLVIPPTVYPPRRDTDFLADVLANGYLRHGLDWLEIGCGSGALSLFAASQGCCVTACDVHPLAVAASRGNFESSEYSATVLEGGPGPEVDGPLGQWGGENLYDAVVWNMPYLSSPVPGEPTLGPMEEAALTDTDGSGLLVRLIELFERGRLLKPGGMAFVVVSSSGWGSNACETAWAKGWSARPLATTTFEDGEILSVIKIWRPFASSPFHLMDVVESTNQWLLETGDAAGATVRAVKQTKGRGRRGRTWESLDESLLASWVVHSGPGMQHSALDQVRVGGALVNLIKQFQGSDADSVCLKWPNDIYVCDQTSNVWQKAGGVLFEATTQGASSRVVLGIGLNLISPQNGQYSGLNLIGVDTGLAHLHRAVHAMVSSLYEVAERRNALDLTFYDTAALESMVNEGVRRLGPIFYRNANVGFYRLNNDGSIGVEGGRLVLNDGDDLEWSNIKFGIEDNIG